MPVKSSVLCLLAVYKLPSNKVTEVSLKVMHKDTTDYRVEGKTMVHFFFFASQQPFNCIETVFAWPGFAAEWTPRCIQLSIPQQRRDSFAIFISSLGNHFSEFSECLV